MIRTLEIPEGSLLLRARTIAAVIVGNRKEIKTSYGKKTAIGIADLICREMSCNETRPITYNE